MGIPPEPSNTEISPADRVIGQFSIGSTVMEIIEFVATPVKVLLTGVALKLPRFAVVAGQLAALKFALTKNAKSKKKDFS